MLGIVSPGFELTLIIGLGVIGLGGVRLIVENISLCTLIGLDPKSAHPGWRDYVPRVLATNLHDGSPWRTGELQPGKLVLHLFPSHTNNPPRRHQMRLGSARGARRGVNLSKPLP